MRILLAVLATLASCVAIAASPQAESLEQAAPAARPLFVYNVDTAQVPDVDVQWLDATLARMVASGEKFLAGEALQVGPVPLRIEDAGDGQLRLLEPDMKAMSFDHGDPVTGTRPQRDATPGVGGEPLFPPEIIDERALSNFNYVDSVTATLKLLRQQRDAAASVGAEPDFAMLYQPLQIDEHALTTRAGLLLVRLPADAPFTGWAIVADDTAPADVQLRPMSVHQAVIFLPIIAKFLALPHGHSVAIRDADNFVVMKDGQVVEPAKGSYLDALRQAR